MKKNKYSTPLWMLATILAGMLSPMQSAVNGQLGHWLQDGNACAVISFASGLVVMFFIIMARKETRQQFAAIPSLIKNRKVPLWNWFAGLCGAMVVFSEGASASALGVATFQTALISALLLSGLLCDRFGIGVDEKKYFMNTIDDAKQPRAETFFTTRCLHLHCSLNVPACYPPEMVCSGTCIPRRL